MSLLLRPAVAADAASVASVYLEARSKALPEVRWAHDEVDVRAWVAGRLIPSGSVHVAVKDAVVGYIAVSDGHVEHLYLRPAHWRGGIGSLLLDHAKTMFPAGLELWCFQSNEPAQAFYRKHGFIEVDRTDGRDNEEREPDILFAWHLPIGPTS